MNVGLARDQVVILETAANFWASRLKANDFFAVVFYFWVGRYNNVLTYIHASPRGTLRVSGKQNSLFPLGPIISAHWQDLKRTSRTNGKFEIPTIIGSSSETLTPMDNYSSRAWLRYFHLNLTESTTSAGLLPGLNQTEKSRKLEKIKINKS